MLKRFTLGTLIACLVVLLPVSAKFEILRAPHMWILILLGILASLLQPGYNPFTITAKPRDKGTGAQIIWSVYITQLAAILEATYWRYPASVQWNWGTTVALMAAIGGLALRTWAVLILGPLFTMHIDIQANHTVVTGGPYKIVRHPSYLGAFIMYVATIVFLQAWFSAIAALLILPLAFLRRIHYEEKLLETEFGQDYRDYAQTVGKFIPFL